MDEEDELFRTLYPSLRRFAAVVGPYEVDPDDLVQDAVARALSRGPLTSLDQPAAYLRRTILNLAKDRRRSFARWRSAAARHGAAEVGDADPYPSDLSILLSLDPGDRAVLFLAFVEGLPFEEVASALGCTPAAARQRSTRARRRLRVAAGDET
ncbi:MAG: sigma-70 family RNA polymerase sigma factor [Acidimicrobiales bacterium]|nr:sigma-70 family RNA polymerase sigma factor [Acidimicrobiales bacterium]